MDDVEMKSTPETNRKRSASLVHSNGHKKQKLANLRKIGVPVNRLGSKYFG